MSGRQPVVDPVQLAATATQHEIRRQPVQKDMALARSNSTQAKEISEGIEIS